jgi:competence ComEA-like helix-hairpin-helix protein
MLTREERRAALFLAAVAVVGGLVRVVRGTGRAGEAVPAAVAPQLRGGDVVWQAALSRRVEALSRPLGPGERVDVDRAASDELQRLPRVGPTLARRIVADREAHGPFGSSAELARVPGVGPGLLRAIEPHAVFSGIPRAAATRERAPALRRVGAAPVGEPGAGRRSGDDCPARVSLNLASRAELECLPGIGPVMAQRIVAERERRGAFRNLVDLSRVAGLGRIRIERLRGRVTVP